jgi:actin related protein 2/3 complex subunit 1A/1B
MAAPEEYQVAKVPITSHSFNADRSRQSTFSSYHLRFLIILRAELAVSLNSNDAQIMSRHGQEWKVTETLSEVRSFNAVVWV